MPSDAEFLADQVWLWDLYPLAEGAWPNISLSREYWGDWLKEPGQTMILRRWVTGPNGPSFLTEYTPADDYITEGYSRPHDTFNGLYRDADRTFYVPRPEDLLVLRGFDSHARPETPDWTGIRVSLFMAGYEEAELARMKATVLIALLGEVIRHAVAEEPEQAASELQNGEPDGSPAAEEVNDHPQDGADEGGQEKSSDKPCTSDLCDISFGGPEEDPYDNKVVQWFSKRLYLGNDTQISRLFWLLAEKPGVSHSLGEVQRAVDGVETWRGEHGEDTFKKAMNRTTKALSKLRERLREGGLDDHVIILKEDSRKTPSYTLISRFGQS